MLKVRLMGTKNDIKWFGKILQRNSKVKVTEFSDLFPDKGTKRFYRVYVEVEKSNVKRPYNCLRREASLCTGYSFPSESPDTH